MSSTGAAAAWAFSNASTASASVRCDTHWAMASSSSARCAMRPSKVVKRSSSPMPIISMTLAATESVELLTASHPPSDAW